MTANSDGPWTTQQIRNLLMDLGESMRGTTTGDDRTARSNSSHHGPITPVAVLSQEQIKRRPVLGGFINEYERVA